MHKEQEVTFGRNELIITKTDLQGNITYVNRVFMRVANYSESDLLTRPHNIIRHADMPRGVFHGLWGALKQNKEFFGFVKNATSDGNYYWVFANITPDFVDGKIVGYFSVRRQAPPEAVKRMIPIYHQMLEMEKTKQRGEAPQASWNWMIKHVADKFGQGYEETVIRLYQEYAF